MIIRGLFDAAAAFGGRLPQLFCGFDRKEFTTPVPYPTSCSPQAWASATPFSLLRTLLQLDPEHDENRLYLAPSIPESFGAVVVSHIPIGSDRITIETSGSHVEVHGLTPDVQLAAMPRWTCEN